MAYFPFFIDLAGQSGLIVGGGSVALRKIEKLLPFGPQLTVVAPDIRREIADIPGLTLCRRPFGPEDLTGRAFVIAAAGERAVNRQVSALCRRRRIPVNVVDDKESSTFLFPALVKRGQLTVGISTSGSSPAAAICLKEQIGDLLPQRLEEILDFLAGQRRAAQARLSQLPQREALMKALFQACLDKGGPLTPQETEVYYTAIEEGAP